MNRPRFGERHAVTKHCHVSLSYAASIRCDADLYAHLRRRGLSVFKDNESIELGATGDDHAVH